MPIYRVIKKECCTGEPGIDERFPTIGGVVGFIGERAEEPPDIGEVLALVDNIAELAPGQDYQHESGIEIIHLSCT